MYILKGGSVARLFSKKTVMSDIPRRIRVDLLTPAEKAIYDAVQAVEALPADIRLTQACILLLEAKDKVADYVDNIPS